MLDKKTLKLAFKASIPVILGYLPTGFAFGLMMASAGYPFIAAVIMSIIIYAGAGQYLAVQFLVNQTGLFQIFIMTFLVNSKHMFYGLSLLDDYKKSGLKKLYLMFSLTDETYALLTTPKEKHDISRIDYCLYVSAINQMSWVISTLLGALLGTLVKFDATGMEFAMTALFIVILIEQLKSYRSKLPFIIGPSCALLALFLVGKSNMLLVGTVLAGIFMITLRRRIEQNDDRK